VSPTLPALTGLTVNPTSVVGGNPATGTVTLSSAAPTGGGRRQPGEQPPRLGERAGDRDRARGRDERHLHGDDVLR
jgi:hypothetical protein